MNILTAPSCRPPSTAARLTAALGVAMLAMVLGGCGPGVGGTGTGDGVAPGGAASAFAGLVSRPVCESPLAAALGCGSGAAAQPAVNGLVLANGTPSATVQAQLLDAAMLDVRWRCPGWQFTGSWGDSPALGARWYGWLTRQGTTEAATVQLAADGTVGWQLTLTDRLGQRLAGPDTLAVVPALTVTGACP